MYFAHMADRFPTADQVATAIVAACRETGGDPVAVLRGDSSKEAGGRNNYPTPHARMYAALALAAVFDGWGSSTAIARMVGVVNPRSQSNYLAVIRDNQKNGVLRWFDQAALERVKAAVRACPSGPAPPQPPGGNAKPAPAGPSKRPVPVTTRAQQHRRGCPDCGSTSDGHAITCRWHPAVAARQVERAIEGRDRFDGLGAQEHMPASRENKQALRDMLAEAAANTARMQRG
jgi:hypothetical protein